MNKKSLLKLIFGGIIVAVGLIFMTGYVKIEPVESSESFASEPVELSGFELTETDEGQLPQKLIIPSLNVFLDVRKADIVNGYWQVFEDTAGWGVGSGIPGQAGNQVIFAHAREGLFAPLKKVENGMRILVLTDDTWYEYEIVQIDEVFSGNTQYIEQTDEELLTLYTCSGFQDSKRLIVQAKRI